MNDIRQKQTDIGQRGFTIIEVMVALAIFAIGFLAVAAMQIDAVNRATHSREMTTAQELAKGEVEYLQGLPFYDAVSDPNSDLDGNGVKENFDVNPNLAAGQHTDNGAWTGGYTIHWTVIDDDPLQAIPNTFTKSPPDPAMVTISKTITVTVTANSNPGTNLATMTMVKMWNSQ